jgi:hypothetical protein
MGQIVDKVKGAFHDATEKLKGYGKEGGEDIEDKVKQEAEKAKHGAEKAKQAASGQAQELKERAEDTRQRAKGAGEQPESENKIESESERPQNGGE